MAGIGAVLLVVYALTMPRQLTFADSGIFVMASYYWGAAHPPGYPLFTLLGHLATLVPLGSVPTRVHLLSALLGAASCALLFLTCRRLGAGRVAAAGAALTYGVSAAFWSQAIIAEVYTLNTLLFFVVLNLVLELRRTGDPTVARWTAFAYGLSLANHWPLMGLASPAFLLLAWPRRHALVRDLPRLAGLFGLGLVPYLILYVRSRADPVFSFNGPLRGLSDLWFVISRQGYAGAGGIVSADPFDRVQFAAFLTDQMTLQLTVVGFALAAIGVWRWWSTLERTLFWALAWVWFSNSYLLLLLLDMDYGVRNRTNLMVIPLVTYAVLAMALAWGFEWLTSSPGRPLPRPVAAALGAALVTAVLVAHLPANDRHRDSAAEDVARLILESVEPDAIVVGSADWDTLPTGYLHFVLGVRPDVSVHHALATCFNTRPFPALTPAAEQSRRWRELLAATTRPVYATGDFLNDLPAWNLGLYRRLRRDPTEPRPAIPDAVLAFAADLATRRPADPSTLQVRNSLLLAIAQAVGEAALATDDPAERRRLTPTLERVSSTAAGALGRASAGLGILPPAQLMALLDERALAAEPDLDNFTRARFYYLRGHLRLALGDDDGAVADWWTSARIDRDPRDNKAMENLLQHGINTGNRAEYERVRRQLFPAGVPPRLEYRPPSPG